MFCFPLRNFFSKRIVGLSDAPRQKTPFFIVIKDEAFLSPPATQVSAKNLSEEDKIAHEPSPQKINNN